MKFKSIIETTLEEAINWLQDNDGHSCFYRGNWPSTQAEAHNLLREVYREYGTTEEQFGDLAITEFVPPVADGSDIIRVQWSIDDVHTYIQDNGLDDITDDQAREVLRNAKRGHYSEFGITWDSIGAALEDALS